MPLLRTLVLTPRETMPRFDANALSEEQLPSVHVYLVSIAKGPAAKGAQRHRPV